MGSVERGIDRFRLRELVNVLYDSGDLMVRITKVEGDDYTLDKSGMGFVGGCNAYEDDDRRLGRAIFALCGLDRHEDVGVVNWEVVRRVYQDDLDMIEVTYDLREYAGCDGVADSLHDLIETMDPRVADMEDLVEPDEAPDELTLPYPEGGEGCGDDG